MIAIWVHFANKGAGAFFLQERPGKGGKIFKVIQFKSMTDERDETGKLLPDKQRLTKAVSYTHLDVYKRQVIWYFSGVVFWYGDIVI